MLILNSYSIIQTLRHFPKVWYQIKFQGSTIYKFFLLALKERGLISVFKYNMPFQMMYLQFNNLETNFRAKYSQFQRNQILN
jgi:hypothetical protein